MKCIITNSYNRVGFSIILNRTRYYNILIRKFSILAHIRTIITIMLCHLNSEQIII